jgi:hypothetical protein
MEKGGDVHSCGEIMNVICSVEKIKYGQSNSLENSINHQKDLKLFRGYSILQLKAMQKSGRGG